MGIFAHLLQPALTKIGQMWFRSEVTVADENQATRVVEAVMAELPTTPTSRPVPAGSRCVLAAPCEEQHVIGLKVVNMVLEDEGWDVRTLGPVPPQDLG